MPTQPGIITVKFPPGAIVATPALIDKIPDYNYILAALCQHLKGDWGIVDAEDWDANERALRDGGRLLSVYPLPDDPGSFWVITEGTGSDRVTTLLLPSDY